jgi:hypothetical protein
LHAVPPQNPDTQESVQHSPEEPQATPAALQNALVVQNPPLHTPEQQLSAGPQAFPPSTQDTPGVAQLPASQYPEQHSELPPGQLADRPAQVSAGWVHTPFAHELEQQSAFVAQLALVALQPLVTGSTQRSPAHAPEQHCDGIAHGWASAAQAGTMQVPAGQARPTQQVFSPLPKSTHAEAAAPHDAVTVQIPPVQLSAVLQQGTRAEHPPPVDAHTAGATQVFAVQVSAPLQHGSVVQSPPVLAQTAGGVQMLVTASQVSAGALQHGALTQLAPVPEQVIGTVQKPPTHEVPAQQVWPGAQLSLAARQAGAAVVSPPPPLLQPTNANAATSASTCTLILNEVIRASRVPRSHDTITARACRFPDPHVSCQVSASDPRVGRSPRPAHTAFRVSRASVRRDRGPRALRDHVAPRAPALGQERDHDDRDQGDPERHRPIERGTDRAPRVGPGLRRALAKQARLAPRRFGVDVDRSSRSSARGGRQVLHRARGEIALEHAIHDVRWASPLDGHALVAFPRDCVVHVSLPHQAPVPAPPPPALAPENECFASIVASRSAGVRASAPHRSGHVGRSASRSAAREYSY